jgi:cell division protein FtsQ
VVAGAVALALTGWLFWGWFRDSSLVRVRHVQVRGLAGHDANQIRRALTDAGHGMTTLDVNAGDLRRAVSPYASVRSLSVSTGFPTTLRVTVDQREAVAIIASGDRRLAVAADGTVLPGERSDRLPTLPGGPIPKDGRLIGRARLLAAVLGAAPAAVRPMLSGVWTGGDGVRIGVRNGPLIRFGAPNRLHAKWAAITRLLAARSTVGAKIIDVRLPERPAASFHDPFASTATAAPTATTTQATTTIAAPVATGTQEPAGSNGVQTGSTGVTNPQP